MNRIAQVFVLAALLAQAATAFSQDSGQPSEQDVLQKARDKYQAGTATAPAQSGQAASDQAAEAQAGPADQDHPGSGHPYSPYVLAFVPGIQFPFGVLDTSFSAGWIGALTGDVSGFQAAGVFNLSGRVEGFQGAGVFNISGPVDGFQGAGVFNIARGRIDGFQGAGVFNMAETAEVPIQAAGVFNMAKRVGGFQAAGVFNLAEEVDGGQFAGVFNVARNVKGVQVGLVNVANEVDGVQLGLVNISRNGVDSLAFSYEPETDYVYGHWQAGTRHLYTLAGLGLPRRQWFNGEDGMVLSFGLGSRIALEAAYLDIDVSAESMVGRRLGRFLSADESEQTESAWRAVWDPAYPSIRLSLGLPLSHRVHLIGGIKMDVDLAERPGVPADLKQGKSFSDTWFGHPFTVWPKWFFGVKF
ncbi:MAG TPA: hypothetical protein VFL04_02285 [Rectinemataceae bacterium]|nr:hypothetical protein [Rectinemataceae bacterium]